MTVTPIPTGAILTIADPAAIATIPPPTGSLRLVELARAGYDDHTLTAQQALELMAEQLALLEDLLSQRLALRDQARAIMTALMRDASLSKAETTHALLTLVPDTATESYDAAKLNRLVSDLVGRGLAAVAAEIVATKRKGTRKGYLMVKSRTE